MVSWDFLKIPFLRKLSPAPDLWFPYTYARGSDEKHLYDMVCVYPPAAAAVCMESILVLRIPGVLPSRHPSGGKRNLNCCDDQQLSIIINNCQQLSIIINNCQQLSTIVFPPDRTVGHWDPSLLFPLTTTVALDSLRSQPTNWNQTIRDAIQVSFKKVLASVFSHSHSPHYIHF